MKEERKQRRTNNASAVPQPWRWLLIALGVIIMVVSPLVAPLPGPGGLPIFAIGLTLVLANSFWAKRRFVELNRRYPKMLTPIRDILRWIGRRVPWLRRNGKGGYES